MNKTFTFLILIYGLASSVSADDQAKSTCTMVVEEALNNLHQGPFSARVEGVKYDPLLGPISWKGHWEFRDGEGERKFTLESSLESFIHHSSGHGREQWMEDTQTGRIRRIGNRQWRKFAVNGVLTYEDLAKVPSGYLAEAGSCTQFQESDSTYQVTLGMSPKYQSFYSKLEIAFSKNPVLPKRITFFDLRRQEQKTLKLDGFQPVGAKWIFSAINAFREESPSSLSLNFAGISFPGNEVALIEPMLEPVFPVQPSGFYWILSNLRGIERPQPRQEQNAAITR